MNLQIKEKLIQYLLDNSGYNYIDIDYIPELINNFFEENNI